MLGSHPPRVWLALFVPVFLTTALMASVGPNLQAHTFPLPESSAPTIYDSVYPDVVARFGSMSDWLLQAVTPIPILIGLVAAAWAINATTVHAFALRLGTTVALIYTFTDVFGVVVLGLEGPSVLANVTANIAGGVIVALIGYLIVAVLRTVQSAFGASRTTQLLAAAATVAVGVLLSVTTYVGIVSFYKPLSADVQLTASLPVVGVFAPPEPDKPNGTPPIEGAEKPTAVAARMTPSGLRAEVFSTRGVDKAGHVSWQTPSDGPIYTLRVFMDTGCYPLTENPRSGRPVLTFPDITQFELQNGATELLTFSDSSFEVDSYLPSATQFWLPKPPQPGEESVQYFLSEGDRFTLTGQRDINVSATWFLIKNTGSQTRPTAKKVAFEVDGRTYTVSASSERRFGRDDLFSCRSVTPSDPRVSGFGSSQNVSVTTDQAMIGMRFEMTESGQRGDSFSVTPFELSISAINGWSDIRKIAPRSSQYVGEFGFLLLHPGNGSFTVYGREIAEDWNHIMLVGDFTVYRPDPNTLRISGNAHAVTRNEMRLNKTRWELLSDGIKVWLIAGFFAISAALLTWGFRALKGHLMDDPKTLV